MSTQKVVVVDTSSVPAQVVTPVVYSLAPDYFSTQGARASGLLKDRFLGTDLKNFEVKVRSEIASDSVFEASLSRVDSALKTLDTAVSLTAQPRLLQGATVKVNTLNDIVRLQVSKAISPVFAVTGTVDGSLLRLPNEVTSVGMDINSPVLGTKLAATYFTASGTVLGSGSFYHALRISRGLTTRSVGFGGQAAFAVAKNPVLTGASAGVDVRDATGVELAAQVHFTNQNTPNPSSSIIGTLYVPGSAIRSSLYAANRFDVAFQAGKSLSTNVSIANIAIIDQVTQVKATAAANGNAGLAIPLRISGFQLDVGLNTNIYEGRGLNTGFRLLV